MLQTSAPALIPTTLIAVTTVILGISSIPPSAPDPDHAHSDNGSWNYDTAVRMWRESPYPRVQDAEGEWMLVAGAYQRSQIDVPAIRDPGGLTRPNGSEYPLLAFRLHHNSLDARFIGAEASSTQVATRTSAESLLPEPMLLDGRGMRMACRHLASTLYRPEQLLCRRETGPVDAPELVNMECYSRAGVEHPAACLF